MLEAAAAGVPMVLSDIPMHRDAVGDEGARFVPLGDVEGFATAIAGLLDDAGERRRRVAAATQTIAPLSIDRAADLYAALYRRLAPTGS